MKRYHSPLLLGLGLFAITGTALAADVETEIDDEITIQVIEEESSTTITNEIALPEPARAENRERGQERVREAQAENSDALREERQEMQEYRTQSREQARETQDMMQQEAQDTMREQAEEIRQQQGGSQPGR